MTSSLLVYKIIAIILELSGIFGTFRVLYVLLTNREARKLQCCLHLPLVFYSTCFSCGYFGQMVILLSDSAATCISPSVVWVTHLGTIGGLGILPAIIINVYIPFLAFKRTRKLKRVENKDVLGAFYSSLLMVFSLWIIAYSLDGFMTQTSYTYFCAMSPPTLFLVAGNEFFIVFVMITFMWFNGMKVYFQTVYYVESMSIFEVLRNIKRVSELSGSEDASAFSTFNFRAFSLPRSVTLPNLPYRLSPRSSVRSIKSEGTKSRGSGGGVFLFPKFGAPTPAASPRPSFFSEQSSDTSFKLPNIDDTASLVVPKNHCTHHCLRATFPEPSSPTAMSLPAESRLPSYRCSTDPDPAVQVHQQVTSTSYINKVQRLSDFVRAHIQSHAATVQAIEEIVRREGLISPQMRYDTLGPFQRRVFETIYENFIELLKLDPQAAEELTLEYCWLRNLLGYKDRTRAAALESRIHELVDEKLFISSSLASNATEEDQNKSKKDLIGVDSDVEETLKELFRLDKPRAHRVVTKYPGFQYVYDGCEKKAAQSRSHQPSAVGRRKARDSAVNAYRDLLRRNSTRTGINTVTSANVSHQHLLHRDAMDLARLNKQCSDASMGSEDQEPENIDAFEIASVVLSYGKKFRRSLMIIVLLLFSIFTGCFLEILGVKNSEFWFVGGLTLKSIHFVSCWLYFQNRALENVPFISFAICRIFDKPPPPLKLKPKGSSSCQLHTGSRAELPDAVGSSADVAIELSSAESCCCSHSQSDRVTTKIQLNAAPRDACGQLHQQHASASYINNSYINNMHINNMQLDVLVRLATHDIEIHGDQVVQKNQRKSQRHSEATQFRVSVPATKKENNTSNVQRIPRLAIEVQSPSMTKIHGIEFYE